MSERKNDTAGTDISDVGVRIGLTFEALGFGV